MEQEGSVPAVLQLAGGSSLSSSTSDKEHLRAHISFYQDSRMKEYPRRLTLHWYGVMAYDRSQTILFTNKKANYDMGLVSTVPSDGSFISYIGFVFYIHRKIATWDLGKGVFDFLSFLRIGYDTEHGRL